MVDADLVAARVREAEPARYLSALYAPEARRGDLLALYAFDAEIAAIRDRVREPTAGEIRLQWWRDALASPSEEPTGNPIADALRATMARHRLPIAPFNAMLEARIFDLYDDPMPDRGTLEGYLGETRSALIQLAALVLDPLAAESTSEAAGHAGCAVGVGEILRDLPAISRRGFNLIPDDLLASAGAARASLASGSPEAARAIEAMVALGREHLSRFSDAARPLPASVRAAFLPVAAVAPMLSQAAKLGASIMTRPIGVSPLRVQWRLFNAARGRW